MITKEFLIGKKVKLPTPEIAIKVQNKAFELGFEWNVNGKEILKICPPNIVFEQNSRLIYVPDEKKFERHIYEEISYREILGENKKKINFSIEIPEGYEINRLKSTFENIVLRRIPVVEVLPTKREDVTKKMLEITSGCNELFFVNEGSRVCYTNFVDCYESAFSVLTEKQGYTITNYAELCKLRDIYNREPLEKWCDWTAEDQFKYTIILEGDRLVINPTYYLANFLVFKSEKLAEEFIKNFGSIIREFYMTK